MQVFSCEYCEFFKEELFYSTRLVTASVNFNRVFVSGTFKCSVTGYFANMLALEDSKNKLSVAPSCLFINKGYNNNIVELFELG